MAFAMVPPLLLEVVAFSLINAFLIRSFLQARLLVLLKFPMFCFTCFIARTFATLSGPSMATSSCLTEAWLADGSLIVMFRISVLVMLILMTLMTMIPLNVFLMTCLSFLIALPHHLALMLKFLLFILSLLHQLLQLLMGVAHLLSTRCLLLAPSVKMTEMGSYPIQILLLLIGDPPSASFLSLMMVRLLGILLAPMPLHFLPMMVGLFSMKEGVPPCTLSFLLSPGTTSTRGSFDIMLSVVMRLISLSPLKNMLLCTLKRPILVGKGLLSLEVKDSGFLSRRGRNRLRQSLTLSLLGLLPGVFHLSLASSRLLWTILCPLSFHLAHRDLFHLVLSLLKACLIWILTRLLSFAIVGLPPPLRTCFKTP